LVYIVTLNYNNYKLTYECLDSLYNLSYTNYKIIVVDDCSAERDIEKIVDDFPQVKLINNNKNLNYCKSFNVGIREALTNGAEYTFLINNDTKDFSPTYLDEIIDTFQSDNKLGMVGSKCIDYVGGLRRGQKPSVRFGIDMDVPTEGYVVKREVFENIGLLNEGLVIYMEDLDFIARLRDAGYTTNINLNVSFAHLGGGTTSKVVFKSNYYRVRNVILFTRKYCSSRSIIWQFNEIKGNLKVHVINLFKSIFRVRLIVSLKIFFALVLGLLHGFSISLDKIWNENNLLSNSNQNIE
jgi:GT2 family glycosyltransferase